jgi:hypothetical protein
MAASTIDKQRNDLRGQTLENPYWITGPVLTNTDLRNKKCAVALFAPGAYQVQELFLEFTTALTGVASLDVTIAGILPADVSNGVVASAAVLQGEVTLKLASNATGFAAIADVNFVSTTNYVAIIVKELTATPDTITAGAVRVNVLMTKVPMYL